MAAARRCHYDVLNLSRDCTADEIRSAYKKLALHLHPDKLVQSGLSQSEATAKFQELSHAYEVLSDPKERSWYDNHRSQIIFSDPSAAGNSTVPDLFPFFSNAAFSGYSSDSSRGFYRVYADVFARIYANELEFARRLGLGADAVREAPAMGDLESPYAQTAAFYAYWLGFATVMDFCWADAYDAAAGVNRKSRRVMEEENKKARRKARREYNETVRGLAEFAKKRDKRVVDMAAKRSLEAERRREAERERRRAAERERVERAMAYQEPDWAKPPEEEAEAAVPEEEDEEERKEELYCVVCGKKFKSEKQWKNHEQSKKHRDKVAELKEEFAEEDDEESDRDDNSGEKDHEEGEVGGGANGFGKDFEEDEEVDFGNGFENFSEKDGNIEDDEVNGEKGFENFSEKDGNIEDDEVNGEKGFEKASEEDDAEDDEVNRAKGFERLGEEHAEDEINGGKGFEKVSEEDDGEDEINGGKGIGKDGNVDGVKGFEKEEEEGNVEDDIGVLEAMLGGRKNRKKASLNLKNSQQENDSDDMEYNNRKSTRKSRRAKKGKNLGDKDDALLNKSASHPVPQEEDDSLPALKQRVENGDFNSKSKKSSKGKKAKGISKNPTNSCEKCGEEFESKNKLHKHLSDTGHSTLKSR